MSHTKKHSKMHTKNIETKTDRNNQKQCYKGRHFLVKTPSLLLLSKIGSIYCIIEIYCILYLLEGKCPKGVGAQGGKCSWEMTEVN